MTRENKVALVVGFALVLLAGVLISDHFSKARLDRPADLAVRQTAGAGRSPALGELIDLSPYFRLDDEPSSDVGLRARPPQEPPMTEPAPAGPVAAEKPPGDFFAPGSRRPDNTATKKSPGDFSAPPATATATVHDVQPGESLSVICHRYYHDQSLIEELAAHNGITDLDDVRAGQRLRLPTAAELRGPTPAASPASPPPATQATSPRGSAKTCTVGPGETLMQIAARQLGSRSRWHELYEANRDVLDDPDSVDAGLVLKLPAVKR